MRSRRWKRAFGGRIRCLGGTAALEKGKLTRDNSLRTVLLRSSWMLCTNNTGSFDKITCPSVLK